MRRLTLLDWITRPAHITARLQLEPRDLWVGVFWRFERWRAEITGSDHKHGAYIAAPWSLHLYVCILPMLPLHVYVHRTVRP